MKHTAIAARTMRLFIMVFMICGAAGIHSALAQEQMPLTEEQIIARNPHGKYSIGLFGGLNFNSHTANFSTESGLQACGTFTGGSGVGPFFGGLFEYPLSRSVSIGAMLSFDALGGTMNASAPLGSARATDGTTLVPVTEQNKLDATLNYLSLAPTIKYFFGDHFFIDGGPVLGIGITKNFTQTLTNQLGSNIPVVNAPPAPQSGSGALANANGARFAVDAALGYESLLSGEKWHLDPFVRFQLPLTQVTSVSADQWMASAISIGFEAKYTFFEQPPVVVPPPPPPPPKPMPRLSASVDAFGVDDQGVESQVVQLQVQEQHTFETFPMLPYIFFPEGQSELPPRYARVTNTETFNEKTIRGGTMEMYYNVLNIIGKRMHDFPKAALTLTGCNSNTGVETNNLSLSLSRAQSVKQYLADVWHITPDRITVEARNLPVKESNSSITQGQEENRRVEITSNEPRIFEPTPVDIVERTTTPSTIRIAPHVIADNGLKKWEIVMRQQDRALKDFTGTGTIPDSLDWEPADRDNSSPTADRVFYKISVTDNAGINFTSPEKFLSVDQYTETQNTGLQNYKISRFSLILFDFGKATLDPRNEYIVDQILKRVQPNSIVLVNGYADSLGGDQYNRDLSQKRAQATADLIAKRSSFPVKISVVARGSSNLYDADDTPEGRYLSRTVEVLVRTPITE